MPAIGIDVGGTKILGGVVADDGSIIARRRIPTESADPAAIVAGIVKVAGELRAAAPAVTTLGVGAAGLVDHDRGVVVMAPNLAWREVPLRALLVDRVGLPVTVENDANAAAWGEAIYGAGRGVAEHVMLTIGTGIGGGLVLRGALYRGAHGLGAELGHLVVAAGGPRCGCGNDGCLEALASGNAIGRLARERAARDTAGAAAVVARAGQVEAITGAHVGAAALEGDAFARAVVAEAGGWLGVGLLSLVHLLDPELFVIGGGAGAGLGELLLAPARSRVDGGVLGAGARSPVRILPASLGDDAGIVGAAALAVVGA